MKWFTLKSSAIRVNGESRSVYVVCVHERNVVSWAGAQGTRFPNSSLHWRETGEYRLDEELEARAADQIS